MQSLKNKRILFLDGLSNLYHHGIIRGFEKLGAIVTPLVYKDFMDRSKTGRIKKKLGLKKFLLNEAKFLAAINGPYDIFFIKNPESIPQSIFSTLKQRYPKTPFINYNWNSVKILDFRPYIHLFDKVYTFDPSEAKQFNLAYYPLFYLPEFEKVAVTGQKKEFVISFVGSAFTPGRPAFLSKFIQLAKDKNVSTFLHLHAEPDYYYKNKYFKQYFKKYAFNDMLTMRFLNHKELLEICKKSLSFIDHPNIIQKGHTIRTFETLAAGLMLVTTNQALRDEPFFDAQRIQIIKDDLSDLDLDSIINYKPSFPEGFEKYRIDNWLQHILTDEV